MTSIRANAFVIFFAGLLVFTVGLNLQEIIGFESRFYLFALEMWGHGPSWFPTTYNQPYPDYTGAAIFLVYLVSKILGGVTKFTLVFPSAVMAALTLSITFLIGALHHRLWGIASVLFLLFTYAFVAQARTISLDQYVTAFTALSFYLLASADVLKKPHRIKWVFLLMILGFAFRGPMGLVIPAGVVCVYYLLEKDYKKFLIMGLISLVVLAGCVGLLLLVAKNSGGDLLMQNVMRSECFGRLCDVRTEPFTYYFKGALGSYAIAYPLAILVMLGLIVNFNYSSSTRFLQKILAWALIILIGLSIPADKKIRYILPMAPALALMCGYLFIVSRDRKYFYFLKNGFIWFCRIFPMIALGIVLYLHYHRPELVFPFQASVIAFIVLQILLILMLRREIFVFAVAVMAFLTTMIIVVEPINLNLNRARDFVMQVEQSRIEHHANLVFFHEFPDGLMIKYIINMPEKSETKFLQNNAELLRLKNPTFIVLTQENYQQLPKKIQKRFFLVFNNWLGRDQVVVLSNKKLTNKIAVRHRDAS